jgi:hypothetical protein
LGCCPAQSPLPPESESSEDVCLLVLAPVKGSIHSLNIWGQPKAGQWLRVPSLQGTGRIDPVLIPWVEEEQKVCWQPCLVPSVTCLAQELTAAIVNRAQLLVGTWVQCPKSGLTY